MHDIPSDAQDNTGVVPDSHAGSPARDPASFLACATDTLKNRIKALGLDAEVFGHGCGRDARAQFANPWTEAPGYINPFTHQREYHRLGRKRIDQHIAGEREHFAVNVANHQSEVWHSAGLLDLLGESYATTPPNGAEDAFIAAMLGSNPPLTIPNARRLLAGKSGKKAFAGDSPLSQLARRLLQRDSLIRRKLDRAIEVELAEVWEHEITVEIDGAEGLRIAPSQARALGQKLVLEFFEPVGIPTFIEPSSSRTGAFVRFVIHRESIDPAAFNAVIAALWAHLKAIPTDGVAARVCNVGGTLAAWQPNPAFDQEAFDAPAWEAAGPEKMTDGENYLWRKSHAGLIVKGKRIEWNYFRRFERFTLTGIDQITFPLHHLAADRDGGKDRLERYQSFTRLGAVPESVLRMALGMGTARPATPVPATPVKENPSTAVKSHQGQQRHRNLGIFTKPDGIKKKRKKAIHMRIKLDARVFLPLHLQRYADQCNWLQSRIIRYAAMKMFRRREPGWVVLKRQYINDELGRPAAAAILLWLLSNGFLERTAGYTVGEESYGYRLGPALADLPTFELDLTNPRLLDRIRKVDHANMKHWAHAHRHLRKWCGRIELNLEAGTRVLLDLPQESRESVLEVMHAIAAGDLHTTICRYGRFHSAITRLKREIRPHLSIGGRRLVNLDIANSQPLFLGITLLRDWDRYTQASKRALRVEKGASRSKFHPNLPSPNTHTQPVPPTPATTPSPYDVIVGCNTSVSHSNGNELSLNHKCPDLERKSAPIPLDVRAFLALCEAGRLYFYMMTGMGWVGSKSDWKSRVWFKFLYGPNRSKRRLAEADTAEMRPLVEFFRQKFPNVYRWMRDAKRADYKALACDMQRAESRLMIEGVCGRLAVELPDVPVVTIHDSIMTTADHAATVQAIMLEEFAALRVKPTITTTRYDLDGVIESRKAA